jgi:hypothetical protein
MVRELDEGIGLVLGHLSGWFGGRLVYEHGMRVEGASPVAAARELRIPGDGLLHQAMLKEEAMAPAAGPMLR